MYRKLIIIISIHIVLNLNGQEKALDLILSDSSMSGASVSMCILDAGSGNTVFEYNPTQSLMPASTMKLITSLAALELLGPAYTFTTSLGYTGILDKRTGKLEGDIIITGGGDPALGSSYFRDHYGDFINAWIGETRKAGIREISGKVIVDDSRYGNEPVPSKWLWEDLGNYYGAGAFGLSVFDNTYEVHFRTGGTGTIPRITRINPPEAATELTNKLRAEGSTDNGYVYAAPYSNTGWISGTIPVNRNDFVLRASIPDPPRLLASIVRNRLDSAGIRIQGGPSTSRIENKIPGDIVIIARTNSPRLDSIIRILNHESVNLYAEHLVRELGRVFMNNGSTAAGTGIVMKFMKEAGINTKSVFIEDGSGLSPFNAVSARTLASLLSYAVNREPYFNQFISSLPRAGIDGTLAGYFKDPVFSSRLRAKSGSLTRTRSYAGYIETMSGRVLAFSIIINNFSGPPRRIVSGIEEILKETILQN